MQKSIAFFDFDGTITKKDSMLEFARFCSGIIAYYAGMCFISPWLLAMKMGLISKAKAKEKLLTYFFKNTPIDAFSNNCISFTEKVIPFLIKDEAITAIKKYQAENIPVIIVSASAENWVAPWCVKNNLTLISTQLEIKDNKITGKLNGENCNENEKVSRIKKIFNLADYDNIYCYGDSNGDKMMLQLATHPHYRFFKK